MRKTGLIIVLGMISSMVYGHNFETNLALWPQDGNAKQTTLTDY